MRSFTNPPAAILAQLPANFPERAKVSGLVETMVWVDERWAHLRASRTAGYTAPLHHPDLVPAQEALMLRELYRESQRTVEAAGKGTNFLQRLAQAEREVEELERLLREFSGRPGPALRLHLDRAFEAVGRSCTTCHREYRDPPSPSLPRS